MIRVLLRPLKSLISALSIYQKVFFLTIATLSFFGTFRGWPEIWVLRSRRGGACFFQCWRFGSGIFLGLPDPLVRGMDPDPDPSLFS